MTVQPLTTTAEISAAVLSEPRPKPTAITEGMVESSVELWSNRSTANAGYWECSPGRFTAARDGYTEICHIVSGRVTIHPDGEGPLEVGPGSTIVMPDGWSGEWEVHETVRKVFVISATASR